MHIESKFKAHEDQLKALAWELQRIVRDVVGPMYHPDDPPHHYRNDKMLQAFDINDCMLITKINDLTSSLLGEEIYTLAEEFTTKCPLVVAIPPERIYEYTKNMVCSHCGGSLDVAGTCRDCEDLV